MYNINHGESHEKIKPQRISKMNKYKNIVIGLIALLPLLLPLRALALDTSGVSTNNVFEATGTNNAYFWDNYPTSADGWITDFSESPVLNVADNHNTAAATDKQEKEPYNWRERRKIWYVGFGTQPAAYPFSDASYISTGFFLDNQGKFALGFFSSNGGIPSINDEDIAGLLPADERLGELEEQIREAQGPVSNTNNIALASSGLELKIALGNILLPIKLRKLSINSDLGSTRVLDRAFRLKSQYSDAAIHEVVNQGDFTLLSVGVASKFYAKWGGALEITWITIEQAISQPKELEPVLSFGLFGFYFGMHV
ncbi:MAG: hypothetical protein K0U41_03275 [Gammaproteobacteria bacterium]|nr:hypothetical protein [Gammaproteobacteria bacterium]